MKHSILAIAIVFSIAGPASALAEEQATPANAAEPVAATAASPATENPGTPPDMRDDVQPGKGPGGMMHGAGQHGKGPGGMMHGAGQHGKGPGGMMHGGGRHGKGGDHDDSQLAQRLDMIEARLAKIEAMLEILVRR
jgi:hypothetical protein